MLYIVITVNANACKSGAIKEEYSGIYDNIYAKPHCNISWLNLNSKGISLFNENFVSVLTTLDSEN